MEKERSIIKNKMKKYLPTNSSFSLSYGSKIEDANQHRASSLQSKKVDISEYESIKEKSYKLLPDLNYNAYHNRHNAKFDRSAIVNLGNSKSASHFDPTNMSQTEDLDLENIRDIFVRKKKTNDSDSKVRLRRKKSIDYYTKVNEIRQIGKNLGEEAESLREKAVNTERFIEKRFKKLT